MPKAFKPGQIAPKTGKYAILDASGKKVGPDISVARGKRLPPSPVPGIRYELVMSARDPKTE